MIDSQGWFDWAERVPGHPNKTNAGINPVRGIFLHSAEGYEGFLRSHPPQPTGVSWHLSNLLTGHLLQHYPITTRCWHATAANQNYIGMEHEGLVPVHPSLTPAQIETTRRVIAEVSARYGWAPSRPASASDTSYTLWEHREVVRLGGTSSACPSGRIPWEKILATPPSQEDEDMQNPVWATWKDLPPGAPYRSYLLYFKADGSFVKRHIRSAEEHMALFRICQADPIELPLDDLRLFAGGPEPDEP